MAKVNPIQLQRSLKGMECPAGRQELIDHAKGQGADDDIMLALEGLGDDQYEISAAVNQGLGGVD